MSIATLTRPQREEALALQDELARRKLMPFIRSTKPDYKVGWFNRLLARELDKFLDDVIAERSPRLLIMAPPRHGKSEVVSRRFPAYALGRFPDLSIIATSYASDLASSMNRDVQRIIDSDEYGRIFPDTKLWGSNIRTVADGSYLRNSDIFEIVGHKGVYKSAGVGAGVTGRGGRILMIDDPIKDAAEAHSETVRNGIWEWYTSTLYTRCEPGGGILVIMTRWHEDDLIGKLLENMKQGGEPWQVIKVPAIAEEDEYDGDKMLRQEGEPLHAARFNRAALDRIKSGTSESAGVGSKVWASLYQQRPSAAEGNTFLRENWRFLKPPTPLSMMDGKTRREYFHQIGIREVIQAWDTALGGKKQNDFTACTTLGIARSRYYVIDVWKGQLKFPDALKQVELMYDTWKPNRVIIEGGGSASGKATVQTLERNTRIPLTEHPTVTDKLFRADLVSPHHESGLVTIFEGAEWCSGFVDQCANFPNIKHDDDVDSWMLGMEYATDQSSASLNITPEVLARFA